jgi:5-methylcytosine-specific restriction enzyme subunit McrC
LILKPDIILQNQIIDTKYKKIKSIEDIKQSDKLQAFAYGVNYGVDNVMLFYPEYLDVMDENIDLGENDTNVVLKIKTINLNFSENDFKEYIDEIIKRVKEIL